LDKHWDIIGFLNRRFTDYYGFQRINSRIISNKTSHILGYNRIISKDILLYPTKISFISYKDIPKDIAITDKVG